MKNKIVNRALSLLLALVCILGVLPLSAFAAEGLDSAPGSITQKSSAYMTIGGKSVRYKAASSTINNVGLPYVFNEQVDVPGFGATRALCAYQKGTLGPAANGQKWNFKNEADSASLKVLLTYIYSCTYGDFTAAGNARGLETWTQYWSDIWFLVAQAMSWYYEHGIIIDVNSNREGFIEQAAEEFVAAMKLYHETYGQSSWIKDWSKIGTHSIIDSSDGGKTGYSAYDYIATGVNMVLEHPEYFHDYHLWIYEWDKSQPWKLAGQSGTPMQHLLVAVPGPDDDSDPLQMTVKKLEAGTNKPLSGVTFTVESADGSGDFSVTRQTGADGTITLTSEADNLTAGQYTITEEDVPEGYVAQTASQTVTVMPNNSVSNTFTFYNEPTTTTTTPGTGSIRKVDADNPTVGIPGAVIRITSVKLDDGGSFFGEYVTKDGGYILKEDLDFSKLPTGAFLAEEITPPEGFILSSDVSKVKQPFVWDGKTDVSLVFENSAKVKVVLKKVDEGGQPLAGAIFLVLRDGQIISTEETQADGTITVSNVTEGHYEFVEVSAPAGMDCDKSPVGVHVDAEDLQGEQTIVVTKVNHHKRSLTISKRDAESGEPIPNTSFHIRGVNLGYENDVVTGADGKAVLESMPSGCYEITETAVPSPWILDTNNRKTVWIDSGKDKDIVVDFVNSTRPGIRLLKLDGQTGKPVSGATFLIEEVNGGFSDRRQTDKDGLIVLEGKDGVRPGAYKISEVAAAPNYVLDDTVHVVQLEENRTTTIELTNLVKPTLKILKVDSITKNPVAHAKFQIWRASGETKTGDYHDLGTFYSNENGEIVLEHTDPGWFKISELEAPSGYSIKQADHEFYLAAGETKTVQVENIPLSALVVYKYDRITGEPVEGAIFQVKYLSGTSGTGGGNGLDFENDPKMTLTIRKYIKGTNREPLAGVCFKVTEGSGTPVGSGDGTFYTNSAGEIVIEGLEPGTTVTAREIATVEGFVLDGEPKTIKIKAGERAPELIFWNERAGTLVIQKKDKVSGKPLANVQFHLTYADGSYVDYDNGHLSSKGLYQTDANGEIRISGITGTIIAKEVKSLPGYSIDPATQTQTVQVNPNDTQYLVFYNAPAGNFELIKVVAGNKEKRIPDVTFEIRRAGDGGLVDTITTGSDGRVTLHLDAGNYYAVETGCPKEFKLDPSRHTFNVKDGENTTLTVENKAFSGIQIRKTDSVTGKGIYGVSFILYDSANKPIGQYTSDDRGYVYIEGLTDGGRYYLRELDNPGYVPDTQMKTVYVKAGEVTLVEWQNTPITGQIQIKKTSEDYNPMNGWPAGTPIPGTEFEIYHYRTGNLVDTVRTDKNGVAVSKPLPLGRYQIEESKAADFYGLDKTPIEAEIEHAGQIVKVAMTNKALTTNVSIKKTGYAEVMPGQDIRYTFSGIGNNSTTALTSFYWRDTLPVQAVRLNRIFTGTYNAPGNYKVVYKTNLGGGEYRTMYDNLSTAKNYTLDASPAALGLASNEYVTEFMLVFGVVPANFTQVEAPKVDCKVLPTVKGGGSFTNAADVGGVYNGQWIQAVTRWTTRVYGKPVVPSLPKTGY